MVVLAFAAVAAIENAGEIIREEKQRERERERRERERQERERERRESMIDKERLVLLCGLQCKLAADARREWYSSLGRSPHENCESDLDDQT